MKLRWIRLLSQIIFFVIFAGMFFLLNRYPLAYNCPSKLFLMINPLVGLITSLAARQFVGWIFIIAALLAMVFGRFFCGLICPLGAIVDFSDKFVFGKIRTGKKRPPVSLQRLKYVFLVALVVLSFFGITFSLFMDPISLLTRMFTLLLFPLVQIAAADGLEFLRPVLRGIGADDLAYATIKTPLFYGMLGGVVLLVLVVIGGIWDQRFWCQYICPSGALFGLLGRFALFRRSIASSKCNRCMACISRCPTRAFDETAPHETSIAECIVCGVCTDSRMDCGGFRFVRFSSKETHGPDFSRRHALTGILGGLAFMPAFRSNAEERRDFTGQLIRPPGAVPEKQFAARCISCGECMKACPTNAIQPCTLVDGIHRLYTPKIVPRIGGCEEKCHLCGYVCPTMAIRPLAYEDKRFAKIGTAVVDRHRCLAWEQNKECMVCDEVCPYNAIEPMIVETTTGKFKVPVVNEDLCIGCGMCEYHCPIFDKAAIVVYKFGENRLAQGPYVNEWQKKSILKERRKSDNAIGESLGGLPDAETRAAPSRVESNPSSSSASESSLPPGFSGF